MDNIDSDFHGSIPEVYDSHLVPILFESYGADLARRVARGAPMAVLEIAAGTGAVTRTLAPLLGGRTRYVVTDLNDAMLDHARRYQGDSRLEWMVADALALPFADNSFDVVLCQFGVMFFPDRVKGFSEVRRVLRPGGRFVFNAWGAIDRNDFSNIAVDTLIELYPEDPPLFLARTPFGYAHQPDIRADLSAAGFEDPSIEELELASQPGKGDDFAFAQTHGSPLRLEIEAREGPTLQQVREKIADRISRQLGPDPVSGRMMALVVEAVTPRD